METVITFLNEVAMAAHRALLDKICVVVPTTTCSKVGHSSSQDLAPRVGRSSLLVGPIRSHRASLMNIPEDRGEEKIEREQ